MIVNIFDYGMNGEGVAKLNGKIVLVPNAMVGETVDIFVTNDYKNYAETKVVKIIQPSPARIDSNCKITGCGGCGLTHMRYDEQLKFKQLLIKKTIKKIARIDTEVNPTVASDKQFNYRNKASFVVGDMVGFYKENSHNLVDVEYCHLMDKNINNVLNIFKNWKNINKNCIKNLVVRSLNNQILVGVVTEKEFDLSSFLEALKQLYLPVGLYQIINTRKDSVVLAGAVKHIGGIKEIELNNFGIKYSIDIMSFHQTNEYIQNKIYTQVLNYIKPEYVVTNAFSGAGLLTAIASKKAKKVYGVELVKSAHKLAEQLKQANNLTNVTNINMDFNKFLLNPPKTDIILLDPPKKGCGKILEKLDIKTIIYISCNPISLAKDLQILTKKYIIEEITPYDMFPNTTSVETVVKLRRKWWF